MKLRADAIRMALVPFKIALTVGNDDKLDIVSVVNLPPPVPQRGISNLDPGYLDIRQVTWSGRD